MFSLVGLAWVSFQAEADAKTLGAQAARFIVVFGFVRLAWAGFQAENDDKIAGA